MIEVDKTWAYDGQFSGYDVFKNRSEEIQEMFRALNPKDTRDTDNHGAICYGTYQGQTTYNIYKVKTKNKYDFSWLMIIDMIWKLILIPEQ